MRLVMPMLSDDDDMTFDGWAVPVRQALRELRPADLVVGHSFGASILVKLLAEGGWSIARAVLLAMPNWGPAGWDVEEYALHAPGPSVPLVLHHCADDEVVPLAHLALNRTDLPTAEYQVHGRGGHQFDGLTSTLLL
jgi:predicted alpha/beta hydrolase family esterase